MAAESQPKPTRLGDLATVKARLGWKGLKADEYVSSGCYFLATPNIKGPRIDFSAACFIPQWRYDESPEIQLRTGDVLLAKDGSTLGSVNIVRELPGPTTVNGSIAVVRSNQSLDPNYLFQYVQGVAFQELIHLKKSGLGVPHLFQADLREFKLFLPRLPEQRQIAAILDTVDDAIHKTEEITAKLKQVKQGLLHDFLTRGIDHNGELRNSERHPEQFKDSPLGRIPKVWDVTKLENVSESVTSGSRGWAAYYAESGALFIRIGNLTREHINLRLANAQFVRPPLVGEGFRTALVPGDLLISITADLGIIGVVPDGLGEAYVNQHIALVRVRRDAVNSRWLGHYLASPIGYRQIRRLDDSGAKAGLNLPTVRRLLAATPPRQEQDELTNRLDGVDVQVEAESAVQRKLLQLKAGLMEHLLSGRVHVTKLLESAAE